MFDRHSRDVVTSRLRLRGYDYSDPGAYFVTICTAGRACLFGEVRDTTMELNAAGTVVESWWHSIARRFPDVLLDALVVMPNHLHGIISLGTEPDRSVDAPSLSDMVHWFKNRTVNDYGLGVRSHNWQPYSSKLWQSGFYEHIIRSEKSFIRIRSYIESNPYYWSIDEHNPENYATN